MTIDRAEDQRLREILARSRNVAVVGISDRPERPSNHVARYLASVGYCIFPVNPNLQSWNGLPAYATVREIGEPIDLVEIFRKAPNVPPVVDDAIAAGARTVWMQLGIVNEEAEQQAKNAGLDVVMNRCALVEHKRLLAGRT